MSLPAGMNLGPYKVLASLGKGVMGEVYRARDARLGRDVAIKVLPYHLSRNRDAMKRFEQEAKALAALSHPNIVSIFDVGSEEDLSFVVMEVLEGKTLREYIAKSPVKFEKALNIAIPIAEGLAAAHSKGIIHRDLKPENIFITSEGRPKILDFGLARWNVIDPLKPERSKVFTETEPGVLLGTIPYMSPEQAQGAQLDSRSDIFSYGCILYELLTGNSPFLRSTSAETLASILTDDPPRLADSVNKIPAELDHVIAHCLEKNPDQRFHSAYDLAFELKEIALSSGSYKTGSAPKNQAVPFLQTKVLWLVAVVSIVILAVAMNVAGLRDRIFYRSLEQQVAGLPLRIAVLPFENLGATEDEYFVDGMSDAVRGKLSSLSGLQVIARSSSTAYKKTTKALDEIARELNVKYLLTATVRWQKSVEGTSRVQVSPELVEVAQKGAPIMSWQEPFDAVLSDVFQVQTDIASRVAEALQVVLRSQDEKILAERPTQNLQAYDAYLRGQEISQDMGVADPGNLRLAAEEYERAVKVDPKFALAWAQLSRTRSLLYSNSTPSSALADAGRVAAEEVRKLAPNLPESRLAVANYYHWIQHDMQRASFEVNEGLRLAPYHSPLLAEKGVIEMTFGRWDDALDYTKQALAIDPRSVLPYRRLCIIYLRTRRYTEALNEVDRALSLSPANLFLILQKAMIFLAQGNLRQAQTVIRTSPKELQNEILAYFATYWDLYWVLEEDQQVKLLSMTPSSFDDDRATWAIVLAQTYALRGNMANSRKYAEVARVAFEAQVKDNPQDAQLYVLLGLANAYLGNRQAIQQARRSLEILPIAKDAYYATYHQHLAARIYLLLGDKEKALDYLEPLLKIPYFLSPGWLRIDPTFDPLRGHPRFEKLLREG